MSSNWLPRVTLGTVISFFAINPQNVRRRELRLEITVKRVESPADALLTKANRRIYEAANLPERRVQPAEVHNAWTKAAEEACRCVFKQPLGVVSSVQLVAIHHDVFSIDTIVNQFLQCSVRTYKVWYHRDDYSTWFEQVEKSMKPSE
jgi:hypothetical protein